MFSSIEVKYRAWKEVSFILSPLHKSLLSRNLLYTLCWTCMLNLPNIKPYTRNLPFFGRNLDLTLTSRIHTSQGHCTRKAQKLVTFNWYYVGDEHFLPFIEVSLFHLKNKRTKKTIFKVNNEMRKGLKKDVHGRGKNKSHLENHLQVLYR